MEKSIFPEELNILIQQYLTDGVLTDKERQVILKKAEGMGLDRDEVDLYLDAEVQKIDQQTDAIVCKSKGKACPYCGAPIPQLADKCPECGQFVTPEASEELKEILNQLEDALVDLKAGKDFKRNKASVERYVRKAKMYYSNNPKLKPLLAEVEAEMKNVSSLAKKKALVNLTIKNKWFWVLIPFLISLFAHVKYQSIKLDDYKYHYEYENDRETYDNMRVFCLIGGIFAVFVVGSISIDNKDENEKK